MVWNIQTSHSLPVPFTNLLDRLHVAPHGRPVNFRVHDTLGHVELVRSEWRHSVAGHKEEDRPDVREEQSELEDGPDVVPLEQNDTDFLLVRY